MADFQINATLGSNSKHFATTPSTISFQSAANCVLYFSPSSNNCFGNVASVSLTAGANPVSLPSSGSVAAIDTTFTVDPPSPRETGPYDITFGDDRP